MQFRNPKTVNYTGGILVIESDDGNATDYSWLKFAKRVSRKHSQFIPSRLVGFTLNINTANLNTLDKLTDAQILELVNDYGWEMSSHGRHHLGLGKHGVKTNANAGDTRIYIQNPTYIYGNPNDYKNTDWFHLYTHKISEGAKEEEIKIVSAEYNVTYGYITLATPLINSYTIEARVQLTDESARRLLQGVIDDLALLNINCSGHAYSWHAGSDNVINPQALSIAAEVFKSARGIQYGANDVTANTDLLSAYTVFQVLADRDNILLDTATNNKLTIVYGHGEADNYTPPYAGLDVLIDQALSMGIKVITRNKAVKEYFPTP